MPESVPVSNLTTQEGLGKSLSYEGKVPVKQPNLSRSVTPKEPWSVLLVTYDRERAPIPVTIRSRTLVTWSSTSLASRS